MDPLMQIDNTTAEGVARMDVGLQLLGTEVQAEPDEVLMDELARQGVDPGEADRISKGVLQPAEGMEAGIGQGLSKLLKKPGTMGSAAQPLARTEAEALVKARPSTNVLGQSDFKLEFGGSKKTVKSLNDDVARFITKYKADYETARGSLTDEEATKAAVALHGERFEDINKVIGLPKDALNQVETRAVLMYLRSAMDEFETLRKSAKKGDASSLEALRAQGAVVHELMGKIAGWRREAGATTREYRGYDLQQQFKDGHAVHDALDIAQRFGDIPPDKFKRWMDALSPEGRLLFFHGLTKEPEIMGALRYGNDVAVRSYMDSLLLSHATFQRNLSGNLSTMLFTIPERGTMSVWGGAQRTFYKARYNSELGVPTTAPGEAKAMIQAFPAAYADGVAAFSKMWKSKESTFSGKVEARASNALIAASEALPDDSLAKYAAYGFGRIWELGSRGLMATDEGFKAFLYRMELHAQAERYAFFLGKDEATKKIALQEFLTNPPGEVRKAAREFASINTFTQELGPLSSKIAAVVDAGGLPARTIATFISTPTNILRYSAQRNPLFGLISPQNISDVMAGGARRDAALARYTTGAGIASMVYVMALNGMITGGGPQDPKLRRMMEKQGKDGFQWRPYSIFIPGKGYASYRDVEPFATMMGTVADFLEASRVMDDNAHSEIATGIAIATSRMAMNSSWMEGLSKFVDVLEGLYKGEADDAEVSKFLEDRAMGFWPSGARALRNEFDPVKRVSTIPPEVVSEWNTSWRILNEMTREWKNRTPGFSESIPADLAPLGEPYSTRQMLGFGVLPTHIGDAEDPQRGPVYKAWLEAGLDPRAGDVPRTLDGDSRRSILKKVPLGARGAGVVAPEDLPGLTLSQVERNEINELRVKNGMVEALYNLVAEQGFSKQPQGARAGQIREVLEKYTRGAIGQWLEENSSVRDQIEALKDRKGELGYKVK